MHKVRGPSFSESIFKAYDIRGMYPDEINEDAAYKIARAFAGYLRIGKQKKDITIMVSCDARTSSPALKTAFVEGLVAEGAMVIDAGLTTTPMHYFAVNEANADGGAMITASHLPSEFNGIKLTKKYAMSLSKGAGMEEIKGDSIRGIFQNSVAEKKIVKKDFTDAYIEFLTARFPYLKEQIKKFVSGEKISGISFDTDEDRAMFQNEKGADIPGDIITALLASKFAKPGEKIVYDLRSSRIVKETIEFLGAEAIESKVGHAFIKPLMKKENAVFGGEVSGHYYFRDFFYCDSGVFAALAVLDTMRIEKKSLDGLVKPLFKYAKTGEINFEVEEKEKILDKVASHFPDAKISYSDGIKVEYPDFWFNLRPSNTENLLRLNIEADTPELLEEKKKLLSELIHG